MHAPDPSPFQPVASESERPASPSGGGGPVPAGPPTPEEGAHDAVPRAPDEADAVVRQSALRALRSLEATEARLERNARRELDEARGKLVQDLLPVLDNLDRT